MSVYVGPEGPSSAKIAFVGEAPGRDEEREERPFVGGSGRLLNQVLARVGINRADCYVTNVCKYRPPDNNFDFFYKDGSSRREPKDELLTSIEKLKEELIRVKPNVICCLGGEPLRALTGRMGITKWRGSILSSAVGKVVGTFHPAAVLREYWDKPILELDIRRIALESRSPEVNLPRHNFILAPTAGEVLNWLSRVRIGDRLSFDIETVPYNSHDPNNRSFLIRCLGLATSPREAICIPFMHDPAQHKRGQGVIQLEGGGRFTNFYTEDEEHAILSALYHIFANPFIRKVAQNAPFDMVRLAKQFGIHVAGLELDTMVGWHTLYSELPKGLDFLCSVLTRVPYYSDHDNNVDISEWTYNCYDAAVTWEISDPIIRELQQAGLWEVYENHVQPTLLAATRTEHRGILVDLKKREEMAKRVEIEVEQLRSKLCTLAGRHDFNPGSPKQLQELLYERLGMPKQYARKRNKDGIKPVTTDKVARDQLAKRYPEHAPTIYIIDEWSTKDTLLTGFLRRPVRADGKMYTHFNIAGTVNRRSASSDPGDEPGTNLQNIPVRTSPEFRDLFIAQPGWSLIKADYSAAEYMVVIWRAKIKRIIDRFLNEPGFSPHVMMASQIYKIPEDKVDRESEQYQYAKNGNYGGNYGMMPDKAAITWKVPLPVARFVLSEYHKAVPEISQVYWKDIQREITSTRTLISPLGLRRIFFNRIEENGGAQQEIFRDAYNGFPQGVVADLINRAWHLLDRILPEPECHVLLQVHDELVFHCRNDVLWKWLPVIKRVMEYPMAFDGVPPLVIPADISYGPTWYKKQQTKWKAA